MRHTPILERQVRDMLQFSLFWSYYKTRLQHKEGTLPEFKVDFSTIGPEKPSTDEKDFYQCFIHFSPEEAPNKDYFSRMALENQLMDKLSSWKVTHTNKSLMDVTITKATGEFIYEIVNIDLHFQCMKKSSWLLYHESSLNGYDSKQAHFSMGYILNELCNTYYTSQLLSLASF